MYNTSDNNYQFSTISKDIVEKMLIKLDKIKDIKYILEPSAGKGNLVKMIQNSYEHDLLCREIFIDTIEINPQFKLILNNLKVPVIHDDFLTFNTLKKYDAIIMNIYSDNLLDSLSSLIMLSYVKVEMVYQCQ